VVIFIDLQFNFKKAKAEALNCFVNLDSGFLMVEDAKIYTFAKFK